MKDILSGYKTIITGWIMAIIPIAGMIGYEIDPGAVSIWLDEWYRWLAGGYVLLGAAVHWFRSLVD